MDARCGIPLDCIEPAQWALLEAATDDYIKQEDARLDDVTQLLLGGLDGPESPGLQHIRCGVLRLCSKRVRGLNSCKVTRVSGSRDG